MRLIATSMVAGALVVLLILATVGRGLLGYFLPPTPSLPSLPTMPAIPAIVFPTPGPTPTPKIVTSGEVVRQIQQLHRLETSSYSVQTVVSVERPGGVLGIGRQKVLVVVQGTVIAGIDLNKLRGQDVVVSPDGKRVSVRLPEAEILTNALDENKTQIYDFQTGLFTRPDTNLILEAQKAGAAQVLQTACKEGILQRATDNSQRSIRQLLAAVGYERVDIEEGSVPDCPVAATTAVAPTVAPTRTPVPRR